MPLSNISGIVQWWVTPKLPRQHIYVSADQLSGNVVRDFWLYFCRWLIHPVKRRAARYYLKFLKRFFGLVVVGVTGSAGKTTTKEMIASILSLDGETRYSFANIDSVYNIPTTILKCLPTTKYLVLEMGVEYPGEMDFYLWLAQPDVAVLTSLYFTHTEFLGDLEGVKKEKTKLVRGVSRDGVVVLNADDDVIADSAKLTSARTVLFGLERHAQVKAGRVTVVKGGSMKFRLYSGSGVVEITIPILGRQNVYNALAAAAVAFSLSISAAIVKKGLENFEPQPHRMRFARSRRGVLVIDDAYNSNPLAARRALETLGEIPGKRKIAVLGEMKELGSFEEVGHREVGVVAGRLGLDEVIGFGDATKSLVRAAERAGARRTWVGKTKEEISKYLKANMKRGDVVLVKGSRSLEMETIVQSLLR